MRRLLVIIAVVVFGILGAPKVLATTSLNWTSSPIRISTENSITVPRNVMGCHEEQVNIALYVKDDIWYGGTYYGCILPGEKYDFLYGHYNMPYNADHPTPTRRVHAFRRHGEVDFKSIVQPKDTVLYYSFVHDTLIQYIFSDATTIRVYKDPATMFTPAYYDDNDSTIVYALNHNSSQIYKLKVPNNWLESPLMSANHRYVFVVSWGDHLGGPSEGANKLLKIDTVNNTIEEFYVTHGVIGAVSPNGRYVVLNRSILDTIDCDYDSSDSPKTCQSRDISSIVDDYTGTAFVGLELWGTHKFSDDNFSLTFLTENPIDYMKDPVPIKLSIFPRLDYLALGDSFSSGEGDLGRDPDTNANYYRNHTDDDGTEFIDGYVVKLRPTEKCHVSTRSYPYKLATGMELGAPWSAGGAVWDTVACSGALTTDMGGLSDAGEYIGQKDGIGDNHTRLEGYNNTLLKDEALNEIIPGRQKQIKFVEKYQPRVVTLTAGGNDAQFSRIIRACVQPIGLDGEWTTTCSYAKDDGKKANISDAIVGLRERLVALYTELLAAGNPDMKLYVLGYPLIVDDQVAKNNYILENIATCGANVRLNYQERKMVAESTKFLNKIIQSAAREAGAIYISTTDSLGSYKLCGKSSPKAMNGITGVANNSESFHPNELGNARLANRVWEATDGQSLLDYECHNSTYVTCPDGKNQPVATPDYFKKAIENSIKTKADDSLSSNVFVKLGNVLVRVADYTLFFNSPVTILLYSEETSLGTFTTTSQGGLSQEVTIPASVKPGYHTLEVTGTGPDGNSLKLWKIVEVQSENPSDYDGDGILNNLDHCQYIEPLGIDDDADGVDDGCDAQIDDGPKLEVNSGKNNGLTESSHPTAATNTFASQTEDVLGVVRSNEWVLGVDGSGIGLTGNTPLKSSVDDGAGTSKAVTFSPMQSPWVVALVLLATATITISAILLRKRNT